MSEYFFNFDKLNYIKSPKPEGCILCLLAEKSDQVVDLIVWENDSFMVTVNLYPYNPAHLLIAPKRHITDIREMTPSEEDTCTTLQRRFLDVLDSLYKPSGYNIGFNMGLAAGASIHHLHLHMIPRYPHEVGIADLIAGKRVLVESPVRSAEKIRSQLRQNPFHL
ncbi:MAG: HIT domain-containing protein [Spirochaetota bacterium]|nr:HIT domain-containing protein [Spirochaetota bacterium]